MLQVTVYRNLEKEPCGILLEGHAGFAEEGEDIVCAAVSVLGINLLNSVEHFTNDAFTAEVKEEGAYLLFQLGEEAGADSKLLLKSCILGIQGIQEQYGSMYVNIQFQEVK